MFNVYEFKYTVGNKIPAIKIVAKREKLVVAQRVADAFSAKQSMVPVEKGIRTYVVSDQ